MIVKRMMKAEDGFSFFSVASVEFELWDQERRNSLVQMQSFLSLQLKIRYL